MEEVHRDSRYVKFTKRRINLFAFLFLFSILSELSIRGGEWWAFISPPTYFSSYENSYHILSLESEVVIRDSSRKIVSKNPPKLHYGGFFCDGAEMLLSPTYCVVIIWQENYIIFILEIKTFYFLIIPSSIFASLTGSWRTTSASLTISHSTIV